MRFVAYIIALVVFFAANTSVSAQVPGGAEAGRIEQRFDQPTPPRARPSVTRGLESTIPPAEAAAFTLVLSNVVIEGSTVYDDATLRGFYADAIGSKVTLAKVFDIAAAITARYGNDGYILSRAVVPPQEIDPNGAVIHIRVIEGYVDDVRWPAGLERYHDFFSSYSAAIMADVPLNVKTLERYLLLANDLPGLEFQSNLVASDTNPGASTLILSVTEDPFDVFLSADNYGVEASGPYQGTLGGALNNLLGIHERIEGAFTVAGPSENHHTELSYASWGYSQVINAEGLLFFHRGNWSDGTPGTPALLALDYQTAGLNLSAGFSAPFIRSRSENLNGTIAFDFKNSESENLGVTATEDRLRIVRAELAYEKADDYGGINQLIATAHKGIDGLGSTENGNPLASRNPGVVDFFRVTGEITRTQQLGGRFSLYAAGYGQWTNDPLLASQECGYGGRLYGRGFDSSIITGDRCLFGKVELRHDLRLTGPLATWLTYAQPYAFFDYGHIANIDAPLGTPTNDEGSSAGLGLRFGNENFSTDLTVTTVVDAPNSQPNIDQTRGWFRVTMRF